MDLSPLTFLDPFTAALDNQQSEKDLTEVGLLQVGMRRLVLLSQ